MQTAHLTDVFGSANKENIERTLDKLLPHINTDSVILCGGIAIRYGLKTRNIPFDFDRDFNDLDIITKDLSDIKTSMQDDFLIYHYHDYSNKPGHSDDFFVAVVDPDTKIKTDIFSYNPYIPFEPVQISYKNYKLKIRSLEDQLATQVLEATGAYGGGKVPPKWLENLASMWKSVDTEKVNHYFLGKKGNPYKDSCHNVYDNLLKYLKQHPEQIVEKPSRRALYICEYCESLNGFMVVDMKKVYKVLGYIE